MTNTSIRAFALPAAIMLSRCVSIGAAAPINVDTKTLAVTVDPAACRWSASVKGTPMQINDVYFLPGGDASGWTVTSAVNQNETNSLGKPVGKPGKPGRGNRGRGNRGQRRITPLPRAQRNV